MTINVKNIFDSLVRNIFGSPIISSISATPFHSALTMTLVVTVIVMLVFWNTECDEDLATLTIRAAVWTFAAAVIIFALSDYNKKIIDSIEHVEAIVQESRPIDYYATHNSMMPSNAMMSPNSAY